MATQSLMSVMTLLTLCYNTAVPFTAWSLLVTIKLLARHIPLTRQDTPDNPKGFHFLAVVSLDITMCFCLPFFPCKTTGCDRKLVESRRVRIVEYRANGRRHSRKGHVETRVGFCFFLFLFPANPFPWDNLDFSGVWR
ncbi:hypothetical protein QBC37DRAFT_183463 [Rhypophila decipiens]|uniref:Uncharacterized protein n=1 Tax=Rhypophila decipiens TaxID=261697 RepID=A0AAN6Y7S0_9PEZI|nr:hypothetical protein QBC37DRAFT_183463 [Rhypophila decipiens]